MANEQWTDVGSVEELKKKSLREVSLRKTTITLTYKDGALCRDLRGL